MAAYAAVVTLKTAYSKLLYYYDDALPPQLRSMCEGPNKELKWLQDFVERLDSRRRKRVTAWLQRIPDALEESIETLYDANDIDEVVEISGIVLETLKKLQEDLLQYEEEEAAISSSSSSKMIGLRDERSKLKEALVNYIMVEKSIFLVHGMAGIGKTMLAREVYEDLDISEWFECRAWVTAGNEWRLEQSMEAILAQVDPKMVMRGDREEIAQQLKECLKRKRCLIVVDDVWDHDIFMDYARKLLLHSSEGSRVMRTSRIFDSDLGEKLYLFEKRLLNKEESWDLLREKVFVGGSCPPQLEDSGKKIAEKCDGLPLTIVTVADLLPKAEESLWMEVAEKRKHQIFIDAYDQISKFPVLPNKVVKLSLSGLCYPWEKMREIASLESLQVLELQYNAFHGQVWEVERSEFENLEFLLIEDLDLVKLEARRGSFGNLHHLSIKHCYKLEEIQLGDFDEFSMVEVVDSNPLAVKSIKQIMLREKYFPEDFSVHCSWKSA